MKQKVAHTQPRREDIFVEQVNIDECCDEAIFLCTATTKHTGQFTQKLCVKKVVTAQKNLGSVVRKMYDRRKKINGSTTKNQNQIKIL